MTKIDLDISPTDSTRISILSLDSLEKVLSRWLEGLPHGVRVESFSRALERHAERESGP